MQRVTARLWPLFFCLASLTGCGGGGGGGDSATAAAAVVKLSNVQPQRFDAKTVEAREPALRLTLTGDVVGDLKALSGQTLYVLVEDPAQLFALDNFLPKESGIGNTIELKLKSTLGLAGTKEGTVRVNVCLDIGCAKPIGNSPISVPYKIAISAGPKIGGSTPVVIEVPFGTKAFPNAQPNEVGMSEGSGLAAYRNFDVLVPMDIVAGPAWVRFNTLWLGDSGFPMNIDWANVNADVNRNASLVPGSTIPVGLRLAVMPIGTYKARFQLRSSWQETTTVPQYGESAVVDVTYAVRDSGKPMTFMPEFFKITRATSSIVFFETLGADKTKYNRLSRVVYGSEANGIPWLIVVAPNDSVSIDDGRAGFRMQTVACEGSRCLSRGQSYTAQVFVATEAGKEAPTPLPVTFSLD